MREEIIKLVSDFLVSKLENSKEYIEISKLQYGDYKFEVYNKNILVHGHGANFYIYYTELTTTTIPTKFLGIRTGTKKKHKEVDNDLGKLIRRNFELSRIQKEQEEHDALLNNLPEAARNKLLRDYKLSRITKCGK